MIKEVLIDIIVPTILLTGSALQSYSSKFHWLVWSLGMAAYVVFVFVKVVWGLYGHYLRFLLLLGYVLAIVISYESTIGLTFFAYFGFREGVGCLFIIIFLPLSIVAIRGYRCRTSGLEAYFPLRNGTYYIASGGSSSLINHHRPAGYARFALDILKINKFGFRAHGVCPKNLSKYLIFEEIVYSPVEGIAVKVVDGVPDMVPPHQDHEHPAGNHVIIKHSVSGALVFLAHLRCNGMLVKEGDRVSVGQPVGRVGNSGISAEPHLHVNCELDEVEEYNTTGEGIPLLFDGRFLRRNSIIVPSGPEPSPTIVRGGL